MSKSRRESENTKPILNVRVDAQMMEEIEEVTEDYETKSDGYREVLELGVEAHDLDRSPAELREYADELEAELSRSIWERLSWSGKFVLFGGLLTALGLTPIVLSMAVARLTGVTFSANGSVDSLVVGGVLAAITGTVFFLSGAVWLLFKSLRKSIAPRPDEL